MKRRNCKICGGYSGKRKVCLKCKEEQPYKPAPKKNPLGVGGGNYFERKNVKR